MNIFISKISLLFSHHTYEPRKAFALVTSTILQFWLVMNYLSRMDVDQTLSMYSGHPQGLFPSSSAAPRLVITNGEFVVF